MQESGRIKLALRFISFWVQFKRLELTYKTMDWYHATAIQILHVHTVIGPAITFTMGEATVSHFGGKSRGTTLGVLFFSGSTGSLECPSICGLDQGIPILQL